MLMQSRLPRALYTLVSLVCFTAPLHAQTIDDGIMLGKHQLLTGNFYSHDSWDQYWEGALKRTNGNIGTITTKVNIVAANYGLFDRLNLIGTVPYVWTRCQSGRPPRHRRLSGSDARGEVERAREADDERRHAAHDRSSSLPAFR